MSAKVSANRRAAFLTALRATGNQTLATERAKVSRAWVQVQRSTDPAFKRAVAEAVAAARLALKLRIGGAGTCQPPRGWGYLDGAELVVRGTGGSDLRVLRQAQDERNDPVERPPIRVQIARARVRQWSPRAEERFLTALTATCNVKAACAEVGLTPASAYGHRKRWPAFAARWDAAVEIGYTELECGLIETAGNFLAGESVPEPAPLAGMTVDAAIHLLHMHKHEVRGVGKRPGLVAGLPDIAEVDATIERRVAALERRARLRKARG